MKILAVRGENLASLAKFEVAFDCGPLEHAGIFAITGPTGAGKTTIIDALCVALFDRTPRLSNQSGVPVGISGQDDSLRVRANDVRGLLRRGTGAGFAEVDFIGRDELKYRSRWEVRRARHSASGRLQNTILSLTCLSSGKVTTGKKGETLKAIESRLGLSFEQFRRSALLAQNDFAAFLHANKEQRSGLLERMTGTEIYTKVSIAAFRKAQEETQRLHLLEESADSSAILDEDTRAQLKTELHSVQQAQKARRDEVKTVEDTIRWFRESHDAKAALSTSQQQRTELLAELSSLKPAEARIVDVRRAREHRSVVEAASRCRQQAKTAEESLAAAKVRHQNAESAQVIANTKVAEAERSIATARGAKRTACLAQLSKLDATAASLQEWLTAHTALAKSGGDFAEFAPLELSEVDHRAQELIAQVGEQKQQQLSLTETGAGLAAELAEQQAAVRQYVESEEFKSLGVVREQLERTAALGASLANLQHIAEGYANAVTEQTDATQQRKQALQSEEELSEQHRALSQKRANTCVRLEEANEGYDRIRIALDLSEQRSTLREGCACPLCGSESHPWKQESAVQAVVAEQLERVKILRKEVSVLDKTLAQMTAQRVQSAKVAATAEIRIAQSTAAAATAKEQFTRLYLEADISGELGIAEALQPAGIPALREENHQLLTSLKERRDAGNALEQALQRSQRLVEGTQQRLASNQSLLTQCTERTEATERRLDACQGYRYRGRVKLQTSCETEIALLTAQLETSDGWRFPELQSILDAAQEQRQAAVSGVASTELAVQSAELAVQEAVSATVDSDARLEDTLDILGCSWAEFGARLSVTDAWLHDTGKQLDTLKQRISELRGTIVVQEQRMAQLAEREIPSLHQAAAAERLEMLQVEVERGMEREVALATQLRADSEAVDRRGAMREKIVQTQNRVEVFRTLSDLIGSADGKKFRIFAQSLTLDSLLAGANRHLADLAPRYLLQRVPGHDLDLQIVDRDLGNDVRGINSLSGGESFLMSLALALGLSSLAARDVRVESLLVDEGFGSLDSETLEVALAVLDSLQATGRKVGLISHVPGFAERIGAQIRVVPTGVGSSIVQVCA